MDSLIIAAGRALAAGDPFGGAQSRRAARGCAGAGAARHRHGAARRPRQGQGTAEARRPGFLARRSQWRGHAASWPRPRSPWSRAISAGRPRRSMRRARRARSPWRPAQRRPCPHDRGAPAALDRPARRGRARARGLRREPAAAGAGGGARTRHRRHRAQAAAGGAGPHGSWSFTEATVSTIRDGVPKSCAVLISASVSFGKQDPP